jgi:hypothetical protein
MAIKKPYEDYLRRALWRFLPPISSMTDRMGQSGHGLELYVSFVLKEMRGKFGFWGVDNENGCRTFAWALPGK